MTSETRSKRPHPALAVEPGRLLVWDRKAKKVVAGPGLTTDKARELARTLNEQRCHGPN